MSLHLIRSKSVKLDLEYIAFVYIPYVARVINTQWIQLCWHGALVFCVLVIVPFF